MALLLGPDGVDQELAELFVGGAAAQWCCEIKLGEAEEAGAHFAVGGDAQA